MTHKIIHREQTVNKRKINVDFYGRTLPTIKWSSDSNMLAIVYPKIGVELVDYSQSTSCLLTLPVADTVRGDDTYTFHYVIHLEWSDDGNYAAILTYRAADPSHSMEDHKRIAYEAQRTELFILDVADKNLHYVVGTEDGFYRIREIDWIPGTNKLIFEDVVKPGHLLPTKDSSILSQPKNGNRPSVGIDKYGLFVADVSEKSVQKVHNQLIFPADAGFTSENIWYDDENTGKSLLTRCISGLCQIDFGFALDDNEEKDE